MTNPIRVLIVDDDPLVRSGLTMMLGGLEDIAIVGEAADGTDVTAAVATHTPDVILMDIRMPGMDGLAATEALRARRNSPEIIILTTFDTDEHVLRALRAGAAGFILKDTPPGEIVHALRRATAGEPALSPTVTRQLIDHVAGTAGHRHSRAQTLVETLSEREREIARAIGQGQSNAEIAETLFMSVSTVKAHITRILAKLDLNNRTQVALLAHDAGLE